MKHSTVLHLFVLVLVLHLASSNTKTLDFRSILDLLRKIKGMTLKQLMKLLSNRQPTTTTSTPTPSTTPETTTPTTMPPGCIHNGQFYTPNSEITRTEDHANNLCHGLYCDHQSQIVPWDQPNCFTTTPSPEGCYHHGKFYPPGEISRGEDRGSNWCWGYICGTDGYVMVWDNFTCFGTTPHTTTTPPRTTPESPSSGSKRKLDRNFFRKLFRR